MKWFDGDISKAILESRREKVVFMVYIEGDNEDSTKMKTVWDNKQVSDLCCRKNCVAIKINCQSEQFQQFAHFYPVVCIPSTYFIGDNGVPLEIVGGALSVEEFTSKVQTVFQVYQKSLGNIGTSSNHSTTEDTQVTTDQVPSTSSSQDSFKKPELPTQQNKEDEPPPSLIDIDTDDDDTSEMSSSEASASNQSNQNVDNKVQNAKDFIEKKKEENEQEKNEKTKSQEINRRKVGQDMARAKQQREEQSMREHAAKMREEKNQEKAAREAVKQAIARDRAEQESLRHRQKTGRDKEITTTQTTAQNVATKASTSASVTQNSNTQCSRARIQFRLPDGSCIVNTFDAGDLLEVARNFVVEHLGSNNITMCTTYPRHQLTEEDYIKTLNELGLTPTSTLIVAPFSQVSSFNGGNGGSNFVGDFLSYLFVPFVTIWNVFRSFMFGAPSEPRGQYSESTSTSPDNESSSNLRRRTVNESRPKKEGNIHRLRSDDDDENNTWNGNSTQQM